MDLKSEVLTKKNSIYLLRLLFVALSIVFISELLKDILNIEEPENSKLKDVFFSNFFLFFVGAVIFGPIFEEIAFRLSLKKNDYFWLSVCFLTLFAFSSEFLVPQIICSLYIVVLVFYKYMNYSKLIRYILISLSIVAFISVHAGNFQESELSDLGIIDMAILFVPQLILSLFLTKIRIQTCFLNAVIFHSMYNLFLVSKHYYLIFKL